MGGMGWGGGGGWGWGGGGGGGGGVGGGGGIRGGGGYKFTSTFRETFGLRQQCLAEMPTVSSSSGITALHLRPSTALRTYDAYRYRPVQLSGDNLCFLISSDVCMSTLRSW